MPIGNGTLLILLFVVSRRSRGSFPLLSKSPSTVSLVHGVGGKVGVSTGDAIRLILLALLTAFTLSHLKNKYNFLSAAR